MEINYSLCTRGNMRNKKAGEDPRHNLPSPPNKSRTPKPQILARTGCKSERRKKTLNGGNT